MSDNPTMTYNASERNDPSASEVQIEITPAQIEFRTDDGYVRFTPMEFDNLIVHVRTAHAAFKAAGVLK